MPGRQRRRRKSTSTETPGPGQLLSFDSLYGWFYDTAINLRPVANVGLEVTWGADAGRFFRMMEDNAACAPDELVVDCPTGGGTAFAAAASRIEGRFVAIDLSLAMLRRADQRRRALQLQQRVHLVQADALHLPLVDAVADRALCFMSLHCMPSQPAVLRELRRVLKPGARLVGTTLCADPPSPWDLPVIAVQEVTTGFFAPPRQLELQRWGRQAGFDWRQDRAGAMIYFTASAREN